MARAYLARTLGPGGFQRLVVIKRLNLDLLGVPDAVERFLAEARVAARIHHANVVGTQQIGRDSAGPFIVLDYIEGGSLDDLVTASPLPIPIVLRIACDALAGLRAVHEATDVDGRTLAILHRDISLQNILVSALDGVARLSDFGVAKSALGKVRTEDGVLVGKLIYFPPEYLRRESVGPPLDLYALGVTLWLALAREDPWQGASDAQVVREILDNGIPPLDRHLEIAPPIAEFVMRACERDPGRRFQSAREMLEVLEHFERERGWLASHGEVAALVSDVLGPELQLRRNAVSRLTRARAPLATGKRQAASLPPPSGTRRVDASHRPDAMRGEAALAATRRVGPAERPEGVATPARSRRLGLRRSTALGVLVAGAATACLAAVLWAVSLERAAESANGAALDVTVVSAPEPRLEPALGASGVQMKTNEPAEEVGAGAPIDADAGGRTKPSRRSPPAEPAPQRARDEPSRGAPAEPAPLRKQNPYRRSASE